jgi:UDPglucose 6-dehydrogenase
MKYPRITVIGLGHVGLPTAVGFAELGWDVVGVDDNRQKVEQIARGEMPFYEPRIGTLLQKHLESGRFAPVGAVPEAVRSSDVIFVCVGTPQREDGSADLSQIEAVARNIARNLNGYKLIVEKSTSPVRTAEHIGQTIRRYRNADHHFDIAVNPEFLREGSAYDDLFHPYRIILGVESERARDLLLKIYRPLLQKLGSDTDRDAIVDGRVLVTDLNTAELIKHASNAFLATKVSFINMVADLCEASGADVEEVAKGIGLDPRIGSAFLKAGVGFGGYCLPKDLRALIRIGEELAVNVRFLQAVEEINRQRVDRIVRKLESAVWVLRDKTVGILGLAFKAGTDDIREAQSLKIIERLLREGVRLQLHDPQAIQNVKQTLPESALVVYSESAYDAARGAHALLVLTEWDEYRALDLARLAKLMETPVMVDGRNLFDSEAIRSSGFEYVSVGRV